MIRLVMMAFFVLVMFLPAAQAEDFEWTACYSGTYTGFHEKEGLTFVLSYQQNGITMSDDKRLNNMTFHAEGVQVGVGENRKGYALCTYKDVDGDMIIGEFPYTGLTYGGKFLEGTGKWKGIKGGISESKLLVRNRPVQEAMPGTYQGCRIEKGTFELPKYSSELELADILMKAHKENQKIAVVSTHNPDLDVKGAYRVQKGYVEQRLSKDQIAGFKAGLCSKAGQKRYGLNAPAAGVLFASGKNTGSPIIEMSAFKRLLIETEIGFMVAKPITQPLKDVSELYGYIQTVMPVIELPDVGFAGKIRGVDLIAANVASAQFIAGEKREFRGLDLNSIFVTLTLDEEVVNIGRGTDAMGDQWKAALWLINTIVEQGWTIEPGQILITGALPKAIPGKQGKYVADFEKLGKISFEVK